MYHRCCRWAVVFFLVFGAGICGRGWSAELSYIDRTVLFEHALLGHERAALIVAAQPARTGTVAKAIETNGGEILARQDDIGYLYVSVPLEAVAGIAALAYIDALQLTANPARAAAAEEGAGTSKKSAVPPTPLLAIDNPYTAEYATQASAFKTGHPQFDGRGVVVAFLEAADPLLPSMKGALDLHGVALPKFAQYSWGKPATVFAADAATERNHWQHTASVTPDAQGQFSFAGRRYRLPKNVSAVEWRVALRRPAKWEKGEENVTVLWAVDARRLWMLEGDQDEFSVASAADVVRPFFFIISHDYDPDDDHESRVWVFSIDEARRSLGFGRTSAAHPSMVSSVIAGNGFLGGAAGGVAPASQLAVFQSDEADLAPSFAAGETTFAALRDPRVDIVESSQSAGDTARGGGARAYALLAERLVRLTGKPLVKAIGNFGAVRGRIEEFNFADGVFAIGGFVPQETWRANLGYEPSSDVTPAEYSGWGPAQDGGLKPDFLALTQTLCESSYKNAAYEEPFGLYTVSGGTSAAAPNAAGHMALLVSAAKHSGVKYDAARLRAAIAITAKFLPGVEARAQGYGLIQVSDAWEALRRANTWEPLRIVATAAVVDSERFEGGAEHRVGRGLFEAGGWTPGMTGTRDIIVTRTTGPDMPLAYRLRWKESVSRGAFSSPLSEVALPLDRPVKMPVRIRVGESGSYSAILDLIDPSANLVAHSVMMTVFAAQPLTEANGFATTLKRVLHRPGNALAFIDVPAGLSTLRLHLQRADGADGGRLYVQDPTGRVLPYRLYGSPPQEGGKGVSIKGETLQVFANPVPGVWQFYLQESWRFSGLKPSVQRLEASAVTWKFSATRIESAQVAGEQAVVFSNAGAIGLKAKVTALGLGSAHEQDVTLLPGLATRSFAVHVPAGATRLEVASSHADAAAVVGLYVYKAPEGPDGIVGNPAAQGDATALIYHDPSRQRAKSWSLEAPAPGRYVIVLDPLKVPPAGLPVRYRDIVVHPLFGSVQCDDIEAVMAPGATKRAKVSWRLGATPADGRVLRAAVALTSADVGYPSPTGIVRVPIATQVLNVHPTP